MKGKRGVFIKEKGGAFVNKILVVVIVALSAAANAVSELKVKSGKTEFTAIGNPSFMKIKGEGEKPVGDIKIDGAKATGSFEFNLNTLDTGIGLRNRHMKENYLKTNQNPKATLQLEKLVVPMKDGEPQIEALKKYPFRGLLTLNGTTKPVKGFLNTERSGKDLQVSAEFSIKITDFKIEVPSYAGITVADEVKIATEVLLENESTKVAGQ